MNSQSLARGLAFFSVGLGLAELLAPKPLARLIGVDEDNDNLIRLLGLRELGAGVGIMQGNSGIFLWSRVAGDAIDLGLLGAALRSRRSERKRVIGAIAAVAGVTVLDVIAATLLSRNPADPEWRVARDDRGGIERDEPMAMRRRADETMTAHQSGHFLREHDRTQRREEAAIHEFAHGD
jgi:uncharacterized protein YjeT (DUF2065 family)